MKYYILCFAIFFMISCKNKNTTEFYSGHSNDTISLSLYDVKLGDSIDRVIEKFPNVYDVELDKISYYLPLKNELGNVYKEMGISILAVDTTFIVDHRLKLEPYRKNGSPYDFPYDLTKHRTILAFFILNGHVLQLELFVNTPDSYTYGDGFPSTQWGETALQMYKHQYGECDSLLYSSEKGDISICVSINATREEIERVKKIVGYRYDVGYIWQWKNAQIIAQYNYNKFGISGNYFNYYDVFRVIYTDIEAVNMEAKRIENERIEEENRIEKEKQMYQERLKETLKTQDM